MPATKRHARELGRTMRLCDREEVKESGGLEPEKAVRASINRSVAPKALLTQDGELLCVFGVSTFKGSEWAVPWMLGTDAIDKHPVDFWKASKEVVESWHKVYPRLMNMVHHKSHTALAWLKRLGFRVEDPIVWGKSKGLFHPVSLVRVELIHV